MFTKRSIKHAHTFMGLAQMTKGMAISIVYMAITFPIFDIDVNLAWQTNVPKRVSNFCLYNFVPSMVPKIVAILFMSFWEHDMSMSCYLFFRQSLRFYNLQLHDHVPISIMHIARFMALCECNLVCSAYFPLWLELLHEKQQKVKRDRAQVTHRPDLERVPLAHASDVLLSSSVVHQSEYPREAYRRCRQSARQHHLSGG